MTDPIRRRPTNRVTRPLVNELLTAITEVLAVPIPDDYGDRDKAANVLKARTEFVLGAVGSYVAHSDDHLESLTFTVRKAAENWPVTYKPYASAAEAVSA